MKKWFKYLAVLIFLLGLYFVGPQPAKPQYSKVKHTVPSIHNLENYIQQIESTHKIKPGNEAKIVWLNDTAKEMTEYAIVYLHGFSASHEEGNPVHVNIAKEFGCNLYLSRLSEHGIDTVDQLIRLNPTAYWESAKEALAIGKQLGKKVIVMGTSTGATLALQLASVFPEDVAALILYSPNIRIKDENAWVLNKPWGLQIARMVAGGKYFDPPDERPVYRAFWNKPYRVEALVQLQEMLETTMNESTFKSIHQPTLMLYYFKDEKNQDQIVQVEAMKVMFQQLGTVESQKVAHPIPDAGDHVIGSPIKSKAVQSVQDFTAEFMKTLLKLPEVN